MNGVSLFSNVGIAETYLYKHNIKIVVANELIKKRAEFYKYMHKDCDVIDGDITDKKIFQKVLDLAKAKKCDFLLATPPCQGMSIAGKMAKDDPRNSLIKYVVLFIKELQPTSIIIENVPQMLSTYLSVDGVKTKIVDFIESELKPLGYYINPVVVDSADYNTPQKRRRAIFLISKIGMWQLPPKSRRITLKEAIGHLPSLEPKESSEIEFHYSKKHNERHILALRHTPTGRSALENKIHYPKKKDGTRIKGYLTTYRRMEWDKPAPTITMSNGSVSSQNNVHPGRKNPDGTYSDARVLTLKEIFILTGLPDDWKPPKWASEHFIREIIGEGVPPKLIDSLVTTMPKKGKR